MSDKEELSTAIVLANAIEVMLKSLPTELIEESNMNLDVIRSVISSMLISEIKNKEGVL